MLRLVVIQNIIIHELHTYIHNFQRYNNNGYIDAHVYEVLLHTDK